MNQDLQNEINAIKDKLSYTLSKVKRQAQGILKHDYLVPNGYYEEQWDWDAFFIAVELTTENKADAVYLKNWVLNYIENARWDGRVSGCLTPAGVDPRLYHLKPFLGQAIYHYCNATKDFDWLKPIWEQVKLVATYRERNLMHQKYGLTTWHDNMESGADNDLAIVDFPLCSIIAADVNTLLHLDYLGLSKVAKELNFKDDAETFAHKAKLLKENINKHLWKQELGRYVNIHSHTGEIISPISYGCFVPLWGNIPSKENAKLMIENFLLSKEHLLSEYGFRTLSKSDLMYNNENIIKPYSNWQGPVWPIVNYLFMHGIINYGYQQEAIDIARKISNLVINDIDASGGMRECYHADTGAPLAAPDFVSWNILVRIMLEDAVTNRNPFKIEA